MTWANRGLAHRPVVMGRHGMVASAHALASEAGLRILHQGGDAVDAAVAVASTLNVVEPYMSGLAGCGYMLVYRAKERSLQVLDYMGPAVAAADPSGFASQDDVLWHPKSALIPAACAGWLTAQERYGKLDRATLFAPAIAHAEQGVPITVKNAMFYRAGFDSGELSAETRAVFMPGDQSPTAGAVIAQPLLAETMRTVVHGGQEEFYRGDLGKRIAAAVQERGGNLDAADLANYRPTWQSAVSSSYRGYDIHCPPPPCSGIQYLETFNMLSRFDLTASGQNSAETIHLMAEAMKLAVADRIAYTTRRDISAEKWLSADYATARGALIDPSRAARSEGERFVSPPPPEAITAGPVNRLLRECTTHFDIIDPEGNAVSVTQSLGNAFGSGLMAGDTGLLLNNLGYWFDLDPLSPNVLAPHKQIEMCMSPAAIFRDDRLFMIIGTPGSFGILQTTPQMISNVLDHGYSIQSAIEAPRFRTYEGTVLEIEGRVPESVRAGLTARGHQLRLLDDWSPLVGGGQGIMIDPETGVLMGGADPRRDGYAIGW